MSAIKFRDSDTLQCHKLELLKLDSLLKFRIQFIGGKQVLLESWNGYIDIGSDISWNSNDHCTILFCCKGKILQKRCLALKGRKIFQYISILASIRFYIMMMIFAYMMLTLRGLVQSYDFEFIMVHGLWIMAFIVVLWTNV